MLVSLFLVRKVQSPHVGFRRGEKTLSLAFRGAGGSSLRRSFRLASTSVVVCGIDLHVQDFGSFLPQLAENRGPPMFIFSIASLRSRSVSRRACSKGKISLPRAMGSMPCALAWRHARGCRAPWSSRRGPSVIVFTPPVHHLGNPFSRDLDDRNGFLSFSIAWPWPPVEIRLGNAERG